MKNIKIKFDKKKLSSNIKQISLNWSLSFLKKKIKYEIGPRRLGDTMFIVANSDRLKKYSPGIQSLMI